MRWHHEVYIMEDILECHFRQWCLPCFSYAAVTFWLNLCFSTCCFISNVEMASKAIPYEYWEHLLALLVSPCIHSALPEQTTKLGNVESTVHSLMLSDIDRDACGGEAGFAGQIKRSLMEISLCPPEYIAVDRHSESDALLLRKHVGMVSVHHAIWIKDRVLLDHSWIRPCCNYLALSYLY